MTRLNQSITHAHTHIYTCALIDMIWSLPLPSLHPRTDRLALLAPVMTTRPTPSAVMCGMMRSNRRGACMASNRSTLSVFRQYMWVEGRKPRSVVVAPHRKGGGGYIDICIHQSVDPISPLTHAPWALCLGAGAEEGGRRAEIDAEVAVRPPRDGRSVGPAVRWLVLGYVGSAVNIIRSR